MIVSKTNFDPVTKQPYASIHETLARAGRSH